ncbi:MAG: putative transporter component [Rhodobacteraceae bacterium HLUCCA08]|nr:MAG: putative transporter component [Rhodobacteraceae bacterium HLUCCA08]
MFETLGLTHLTAPQAAILFGLALGVLFGLLAQRTRFCLRRAIAGAPAERRPAAGIWLTALAVAILGSQGAVAAGWVSFEAHRLLAGDLPWLAIVTGGLMFGIGMILTRGCASRLTVLSGQGNLRALVVLAVFAIVAHATLKGVLAPLRMTLGQATLPLGGTLPGPAPLWAAALAVAALAVALRSGAGWRLLAGAALLGALVPLGWVGTGLVLQDDFDPVPLESLSFTAPWADALFFTIAASSIPANFGVGLIGGTLLGALVAALAFREFRWEGFEGPGQMGRYLAGGALMGAGGVLAGGCSVGAGLAGVPTLGLAALAALGSIVAGGLIGRALSDPSSSGSAAPAARPQATPAA